MSTYLGGLMDKVADSGSADAGSIPVRGAKDIVFHKELCLSLLKVL